MYLLAQLSGSRMWLWLDKHYCPPTLCSTCYSLHTHSTFYLSGADTPKCIHLPNSINLCCCDGLLRCRLLWKTCRMGCAQSHNLGVHFWTQLLPVLLPLQLARPTANQEFFYRAIGDQGNSSSLAAQRACSQPFTNLGATQSTSPLPHLFTHIHIRSLWDAGTQNKPPRYKKKLNRWNLSFHSIKSLNR